MRRKESYGILILLFAVIAPGLVLAQEPSEDPKVVPAAIESPASNAADDLHGDTEAAQKNYATALDGSGLISLDSRASGRLLLGATVTGGWDSNPNNLSNGIGTGLYTVAPYVGLQTITPTLRTLFQYQFTNTSFVANYGNQAMHLGSVTVLKSINDRWSWDMKARGSYGQDSIRFLASPQTVAVGGVPGVGPNSASYLPNAGTVTHIDGSFGLSFRQSQRDTVELRAENTFTNYTGLTGSNSVASTSLVYQRDVSPAIGATVYEQNSFYYGALQCQSFGAGVGLHWRPREQTSLSLSGGPQLDTAACGSQQGFAFNASFNTRLTGRSQVYLLAARQPTTSYLGPGLWQESVSGGYQRQVTSVGTLGFDVGYVTSNTLVSLSAYKGTYFDAIYNYQLGHGVRASYSYRGYIGDSGGTRFSRNVAQFSVAWTPGAGHIFQ